MHTPDVMNRAGLSYRAAVCGGREHVEIEGYDDFALIGSGGNAHVYKATTLDSEEIVAVKVLHGGGDETVTRRFERERTLMSELDSIASVVPVHESGFLASGDPFLVMPLYEGGSLQDHVNAGPMPWRKAVSFMKPIADSIALAHAKRILHLDVKPANVLLDADNKPWLADFGIAETMGPTTSMSAKMMTPAYTPPERIGGGKPDERTDTYGLMATLFALLAGRQPFVTEGMDNVVAVATAVQNDPLPIEWLEDDVPDSVKNLLLRGMAKKPSDRPQNAIELVGLFEDVLEGRDVAPPFVGLSANQLTDTILETDITPAPLPETPNRLRLLLPLGLLLIVGVVATMLVNNSGGDNPDSVEAASEETVDAEADDASTVSTDTTAAPTTTSEPELAPEDVETTTVTIESAEPVAVDPSTIDFDCRLDFTTIDDLDLNEGRYGSFEGEGCEPIYLGVIYDAAQEPWAETVSYCVASVDMPGVDIWLQVESETASGWIELDHENPDMGVLFVQWRDAYELHVEPDSASASQQVTFADIEDRIIAMVVRGAIPETQGFMGGCRESTPDEADPSAYLTLDWLPQT